MFPQFAGVSLAGMGIIQTELDYANLLVCCSLWGIKCERGRGLLTAHYSSQALELLEASLLDPDSAGGTQTFSDRISSEKVGEVETKFHKPVNLNSGFSNEHNDAASNDLKMTLYGVQFMALKRSLGIFLATTSSMFRI